jgi:hypothetical protein
MVARVKGAMTLGDAIAAGQKGHDYQARWFWIQACRMFDERTKVVAVEYESKKPDAFDDVAVYYNDQMTDGGYPLHAEFYQVKFHVRGDGCVTFENFTDPKFINATKYSILERLKAAQEKHAPEGRGALFYFFTVWPIDPRDALHKVLSYTDGSIVWEKLIEGKTEDSATGKMRIRWREHLGLKTDEELRVVLQPLRIETGFSLRQLGSTLNDKLTIAGFRRVDEDKRIHPYDDLTRKLLYERRTRFTAPELEQVCKDEGLFIGRYVVEPDVYRIGIRSFMRAAENLGDETNEFLSLTEYFDGRHIKEPSLWQDVIYPRVRDFLSEKLAGQASCHVHLHAHTSIAFATGYCLDSKSRIAAYPVQYIMGKREVWAPVSGCDPATYPTLTELETSFEAREGADVAVALGITHDIRKDVEAYVADNLKDVGRIMSFALPGGHGGAVIKDGTHARLFAEQLSQKLKTGRSAAEHKGTVHLFIAAPNGLTFFVGQLARSFGRCTLYEYDFDSNELGAYKPSITYPNSG